MTKNGMIFEEVGISQQKEVFYKILNKFFPLYENLSFGNILRELVLPSLPHIDYL